MDEIKEIIEQFQSELLDLGFDDKQIADILYEVVLIASAKLAEQDMSFLTPDEVAFVSNKDILGLSREELAEITAASEHLGKYLKIYAQQLRSAIQEFDKIVDNVSQEEQNGILQ